MNLLRSHSENQEIITVPKNCCQNFFFLHTCKYKSSLCTTNNKYNVIYSRTLNKITDSVASADSEMTSTQTKKNMFTFCSLSAHFKKRRNNLNFSLLKKNMFTFCSLSAHFAKRRNNLLNWHCRKRMSSLSAVKTPISSLSAAKKQSVKLALWKKNIFTFCSEEQSPHFLQ